MAESNETLDDLLNSSFSLTNLDHSIQLETSTLAAKSVETLGLAGKIIADRAISRNKVKAVLLKVWRLAKGVSITPKGENLFLFHFLAEGDRRKVMELGPWSIDGWHLILKPLSPHQSIEEIEFTTTTFLVQVHNLPSLNVSKENAQRIGKMIGKLKDFDFTNDGELCWHAFMRLQVELQINKPLPCGFYLDRAPHPDLWIHFRYEKLADFCFKCGRLGHNKINCTWEINMSEKQKHFSLGPRGYGPWMSAKTGSSAPTWIDAPSTEADSQPSSLENSRRELQYSPQFSHNLSESQYDHHTRLATYTTKEPSTDKAIITLPSPQSNQPPETS